MAHKKQQIQITGYFGDCNPEIRRFEVGKLMLVERILRNKKMVMILRIQTSLLLRCFLCEFFLLEHLEYQYIKYRSIWSKNTV